MGVGCGLGLQSERQGHPHEDDKQMFGEAVPAGPSLTRGHREDFGQMGLVGPSLSVPPHVCFTLLLMIAVQSFRPRRGKVKGSPPPPNRLFLKSNLLKMINFPRRHILGWQTRLLS